MKYPILYLPTLEAQKDLIERILGLKLGYHLNGYKAFKDGWPSYLGCYAKDNKPIYTHIYVVGASVLPTTVAYADWAGINDAFLKVNNVRQFLAYLKAHAQP